MLEASLPAVFGTDDVRHTTGSIVTGAKGVLGPATAGRGCKILLRVIPGTESMDNRLRTENGACPHRFARYEIKLFEHNNVSTDACPATLKTTF